jgi:outer membrane protein assembly factor BamE
MTRVHKIFSFPLAVACVLAFSACRPIYHLDTQQGNLFTKVQVDSLKPGMSKHQVVLTLGSPSVVNPFQQSRWDYISTERHGNGVMQSKTLTLYFEGDNLAKVDGDYFAENPTELILEATKYKRQYPDDKRADDDKKKQGGGDQGGT